MTWKYTGEVPKNRGETDTAFLYLFIPTRGGRLAARFMARSFPGCCTCLCAVYRGQTMRVGQLGLQFSLQHLCKRKKSHRKAGVAVAHSFPCGYVESDCKRRLRSEQTRASYQTRRTKNGAQKEEPHQRPDRCATNRRQSLMCSVKFDTGKRVPPSYYPSPRLLLSNPSPLDCHRYQNAEKRPAWCRRRRWRTRSPLLLAMIAQS